MYILVLLLAAASAFAKAPSCPKLDFPVAINSSQLVGNWYLHGYLDAEFIIPIDSCMALRFSEPRREVLPTSIFTQLGMLPVIIETDARLNNSRPPVLSLGPNFHINFFNHTISGPLPAMVDLDILAFKPHDYMVLWSCLRHGHIYMEQAAIFMPYPDRKPQLYEEIREQMKKHKLSNDFAFEVKPEMCQPLIEK